MDQKNPEIISHIYFVMGVRINLSANIVYDIPSSKGLAMDNEGLEVSPVLERKPYPRSDTSLTQVDLDILSRQQDPSLGDSGISVRYCGQRSSDA